MTVGCIDRAQAPADGTLHVCPLSRLADTLAASDAGSVVSLLAVRQRGLMPLLGADVRHLALDLSDISVPTDGHVLAGEGHMADLLAFARAWDRRRPLLIHCYAGVSRSTAAAFAVLCALAPTRSESELALRLREASPSATPNARLVALADAALGRDGRMVAAIRAIGRGQDCFEGDVARLDVPGHGPKAQIPAYQL